MILKEVKIGDNVVIGSNTIEIKI
nr:hypothetical protein [uncultured Romboutsia sp.]